MFITRKNWEKLHITYYQTHISSLALKTGGNRVFNEKQSH